MAFKMMGGKDPKSKTGNGLPSSLMFIEPKKQDSPLQQTRRKGYYTKAQLLAEKQGGTKTSVAPVAKPKYVESRKGYITKAQLKVEKQKKSASSVGRIAMAADTKKRKNLQSTAKGKSGRDADDKARKNKTGVYALKTNAPKTIKKPKRDIKTTKMSLESFGLKDGTKKTADVKNVVKRKVAKLATSEPTEKKAPKLAARRVSEPKKEVKKTRSQRIRAKGEAALASGDKTKALRLRRRMQRVEAREKRRADIKAKK